MLKGIDRLHAGDDGASLANYTALRASFGIGPFLRRRLVKYPQSMQSLPVAGIRLCGRQNCIQIVAVTARLPW